MIIAERSKIYDEKIGSTVDTITSECSPDADEDIIDALTRLICRDLENPGDEGPST